MATRSLAELAAATGATLVGLAAPAASSLASGAAIDSRKVAAGALFFALPGQRVDGHAFVPAALAAGAAAAVVSRRWYEQQREQGGPPAPGPLLVVDDPLAALHALTRAVRRTLPRQGLVGVTGSTGKTTTKELLGAVFAAAFPTATSPGNLNNLLGFPLALLGVPETTEWMIAELGMSTPGELARISALARPDVAVYTNVRAVHLENFASVDAIAEAKAEMLRGLAAGGTIVANADDARVLRITRRHLAERDPSARLVTYGLSSPEAQITAREVVATADGMGMRFRLVVTAGAAAAVPGSAATGEVAVELPLLGRHNVENALAAAAAGWARGIPLATIAGALAGVRPAAMRGVVERFAAGTVLVDDSYNSNPAALERALEAATAIPARRRWAVLGDMLELGPEAARFHRECGAVAARLGFSPVIAVGAFAAELLAGVVAAGGHGEAVATAAAAVAPARATLAPGDLVLVKGSRGVGLELVAGALRGAAGQADGNAAVPSPAGLATTAASSEERG
jgi:UDP-N-acetylmuramoyl-tripeptide--D-alanyl-D-alanine ligase